MRSLNLKPLGKNDISFYLAIEKYFLPQIDEDLFFLWDLYKAVICGKNQLISAEVNLDYTEKNGIKVFRRHTGGGAVFADEGCFMFTFLTKNTNREEVFKKYLGFIQDALKKLGLDVVFSGRNDLLFQDKKFSGNAFMTSVHGSILHGTMMFDTSIEKMVASLTPDDSKLISKGISSVRQRVINLKDYLDFDIYGLMDYIYNDISTEEIYLSDSEIREIKELEKMYLTKEWLNYQNPPYTFKNKKRYPWGGIEVMIEVKKGKIKAISFNGDFFTNQELTELYQFFFNQEFTKESFEKILAEIQLSDYIVDASPEEIIDLVWR
ncbi:MAG: lipoate--protein ligase [Bacilli bacterium]|jgi:lipoate-protein ligase A